MARIFISYSRQDEGFARRLATSLADMGADVWIDIEDISAGTKWSRAIQEGLDSGQLLVVIITPDSMASTNVEDEWQYYLDQDKPVIPILLKPAKMHFQLNRLQYVDVYEFGYDIALIHLHEELKRQGLTITLPQIQSQATARHEVPPQVKQAQQKKRDTQPLRRVDPAQETDSPARRHA
jgi:hypothetical protein